MQFSRWWTERKKTLDQTPELETPSSSSSPSPSPSPPPPPHHHHLLEMNSSISSRQLGRLTSIYYWHMILDFSLEVVRSYFGDLGSSFAFFAVARCNPCWTSSGREHFFWVRPGTRSWRECGMMRCENGSRVRIFWYIWCGWTSSIIQFFCFYLSYVWCEHRGTSYARVDNILWCHPLWSEADHDLQIFEKHHVTTRKTNFTRKKQFCIFEESWTSPCVSGYANPRFGFRCRWVFCSRSAMFSSCHERLPSPHLGW